MANASEIARVRWLEPRITRITYEETHVQNLGLTNVACQTSPWISLINTGRRVPRTVQSVGLVDYAERHQVQSTKRSGHSDIGRPCGIRAANVSIESVTPKVVRSVPTRSQRSYSPMASTYKGPGVFPLNSCVPVIRDAGVLCAVDIVRTSSSDSFVGIHHIIIII